MNTIRPRSFGHAFWAPALFLIGLLLSQADKTLAQQWTTSGNIIYNTNTGNVGIGTSTPGTKLEVGGSLRTLASQPAFYVYDTSGTVDARQFYFWNAGGSIYGRWVNDANSAVVAESITFKNNGNVGIGATAPNSLLNVGGIGDATLNPFRPNSIWTTSSGSYNSVGIIANVQAEVFYKVSGGGIDAKWFQQYSTGGNLGFRSITDAYGLKNETLFLTNSGNVGIGTVSPSAKLHIAGNAYVTGSLTVDGNIAAKYQDVAEWVPASHAISAGTVVVLDAEQSNHVLPSSRAYDTSVAGVVSASPGVILGEGGEGKVMVATTGRVRVKVDATSAPIRVGDLLVTSDKEGIAMRSQPLDLGGTPIHRPGTLIGKALEPLDKGVGEILVLLSLQ